MDISALRKLYDRGLIPQETLQQLEKQEKERLFSVYWELRLILYLGILLLTGGMGVLVYKNIDTIGHQAVLCFIGLVTAGCFYYCLKKKQPFSWEKVEAPNTYFDYILLLGCLSLLIFLGYWQYVYSIFGENYGMATFIPMLILFGAAYYFDHLGVLSLAITNLGAWAGISITPLTLLREGNFDNGHLINTGVLLGLLLLALGYLSERLRLKAHFQTTYTNFGLHLFFIAALAGLFDYTSIFVLWFIGLAGIAFLLCWQAMARKSFYFVLMIVLYAYIGLVYTVLRLIWLATENSNQGDPFGLMLLFITGSAVAAGVLLVRLHRQLKSHDRIQ